MTSIGRVALFKGQSQYDTVRCMTDDLADGFREAGYEILMLDLATTPLSQLATELSLAADRGDLLFCHGFYGWGIDLGTTHETFADRTGIPFVIHLIDPPYMIDPDRLTRCRNQVVLMHDADALGYLRAFPAIRGTLGVVNPGAPAIQRPLEEGVARRSAERDLPPIAAMTAHPMHEMNAQLGQASPTAQTFIQTLIEVAASDANASVHGAALELIRPMGWLEAPERFAAELADVRSYMNFAYTYAHALRRANLAPLLLELPIMLAGNGWNQFAGATRSRAMLLGPLSFRTIEEMMGRSPLMVNVMPPWADALHDRLLYAMAGGAHVVTTTNLAIDRHLGSAVTRIPLDGEGLIDTVTTLMGRSAPLAEYEARATAVLTAGHTWAQRARDIAAAVAGHRASVIGEQVRTAY